VDVDPVSGGVNESLTQDQVNDIASFLDSNSQTVYNKDQVISPQGAVSRTIYCVAEGSVSARNSQGDVLVRRGPREIFGEWSFFSTGNKGAGAAIVADEDSTTVLELNKASIDRIRLTCPHVSARGIASLTRARALSGARTACYLQCAQMCAYRSDPALPTLA
jgi:signal-transduction protein with cAMP-binding, CBS, and nucleotidyltransferase domain